MVSLSPACSLLVTSPQTTSIVTEKKGNSGGEDMRVTGLAGGTHWWITVLVIPFSATRGKYIIIYTFAGFLTGVLAEKRCTSSVYSKVICLAQIGRCTRCWMQRQLSNPTGLWGTFLLLLMEICPNDWFVSSAACVAGSFFFPFLSFSPQNVHTKKNIYFFSAAVGKAALIKHV